MEQVLHVARCFTEKYLFYLCYAKKKLLENVLYPYTCQSLQIDFEIDTEVGLMAPHLAPGRSELVHQ